MGASAGKNYSSFDLLALGIICEVDLCHFSATRFTWP